MKTSPMRGILTKEVRELSKKLLGYEISCSELRLMPYIQYVCMNGKRLNHSLMKDEEFNILDQWSDKGYIKYSEDFIEEVDKDFWMSMNEILYNTYVNI